MIEAHGLHKAFGSVIAVDDISFKAPDGQITGLLGPNGAGKTTTFRMLYGLLSPQQGKVTIDGIPVLDHHRDAVKRLGVLTDASGLYTRLTAREHIRYFGQLHDIETQTLEKRIDSLARLLDMGKIIDRRTEGFSQGEKMKVSLARALIHEPGNIILDEPTNGLDVMSTRTVRAFIRTLRDQGKCILFSSHIMQEVASLCNSIIVLAFGQVVLQGTAEELKQHAGVDDLEEAFIRISLQARREIS